MYLSHIRWNYYFSNVCNCKQRDKKSFIKAEKDNETKWEAQVWSCEGHCGHFGC